MQVKMTHLAAGLTAVVGGYSSAVVLVIQAASAAGASDTQTVSWLVALGIGMGVTCIAYSWWYKKPVVTAWSTPGAAFLAGASGNFTLPEVIGACVLSGVLTLATAQSRWLFRQIEALPQAIGAAMLAGILLPLCLAIFSQAADTPEIVAAALLLYLAGSRLFPRYLMLAMLVASLGYMLITGTFSQADVSVGLPELDWVTPSFSIKAFTGLALPLFIITMLTQNLPGIAIAKSYDFSVDNKVVMTGIGAVSVLLAPVGGFAFNYAAITAALCMGDEADDDRTTRYKAAMVAGAGYLLMAALASVVVVVFVVMPEAIIHLLAGLALLATLESALTRAMEPKETRHAAMLTFLCSASGLTLANLTAPVWGLGLGLMVLLVFHRRNRLA